MRVCGELSHEERDALLARAALDYIVLQGKYGALLARVEKAERRAHLHDRLIAGLQKIVYFPPKRDPSSRSIANYPSLRQYLRDYVVGVYESTGRNVTRTAEILKIKRTSLYHYLPARNERRPVDASGVNQWTTGRS